jgi:putative phosphoribosyl transferase
MVHRFRNRTDAGQRLAEVLTEYADKTDVVVLGLVRGGMPVAFEVARSLRLPLDICLVRKLGVPGSKELAMGAITEGGAQVLNQEIIDELSISSRIVAIVAAREQKILSHRESLYRAWRTIYPLQDKTVLLIDDGLATGATMRSAIAAVTTQQPKAIIVAVPVGVQRVCDSLTNSGTVKGCICLLKPEPFQSVGLWYDDFTQITDAEVCTILYQANQGQSQNQQAN